jgi:hypothetical protein
MDVERVPIVHLPRRRAGSPGAAFGPSGATTPCGNPCLGAGPAEREDVMEALVVHPVEPRRSDYGR